MLRGGSATLSPTFSPQVSPPVHALLQGASPGCIQLASFRQARSRRLPANVTSCTLENRDAVSSYGAIGCHFGRACRSSFILVVALAGTWGRVASADGSPTTPLAPLERKAAMTVRIYRARTTAGTWECDRFSWQFLSSQGSVKARASTSSLGRIDRASPASHRPKPQSEGRSAG